MPRLTLRTLLAYIDDTLEPSKARSLGTKVAASDSARELIERIKKVTRRRGLHSPVPEGRDDVADPNTVAEYLSDSLDSAQVKELEETCLKSDVHLAEVAAVHQILTIVLTEPVRVPPSANQRMYKLVEPPASQPDRLPSKARPVAGMSPEALNRSADVEEGDAGLLLGMKRYSSATLTTRLGLVGAVAACAGVLVVAVIMTLWHSRSQEPAASPSGSAFASVTPTTVTPPAQPLTPEPVVTPTPEVVAPKPKEKVVDPIPMKKVDPVEPKKVVEKVLPPREGRIEIGKAESPNTMLFTRPDNGLQWLRVDAAEPVMSQDVVLCLPAYKADIRLSTGLSIHLWGNTPDQLHPVTTGSRVPLETRLQIHPTAAGYQADITLLAGRIYFNTKNADGARVRVRFAGEVWDFTLRDEKADVMIEVVTRFEPGSLYLREGGEAPPTRARIAVTKGTAECQALGQHEAPGEVTGPAVFTWKTGGKVEGPKPYDRADLAYARYIETFLPGGRAAVLNQAKANFVSALTDPTGLQVMLAERLTEPADPNPEKQDMCRLAVYALPASATGPDAVDELKLLVDALSELTRGYARGPACEALSAWLARDTENTNKLYTLMVDKKRIPAEEADLLLRLLRGYTSTTTPNPVEWDQLLGYLNAKSLPVRQLALWNLQNFVDPASVDNPALRFDVAFNEPEAGYDKFVAAWRNRLEEIKKGMNKN